MGLHVIVAMVMPVIPGRGAGYVGTRSAAPSEAYLLVPGTAAGAGWGPWLGREMSALGLAWALTQHSPGGRKLLPQTVTWGSQ